MPPVIVLAGGLATRMRPLTDKIPKSLLAIGDKPFIFHQLNLIKSWGISQVILAVGYLGDLVEKYVSDGSRWGLEVSYSYDGDKGLGTGGALRKAIDLLPDEEYVATVYGDSYLPINFSIVAEAYKLSGKNALMTVYRNENAFDSSNASFSSGTVYAYDKVKQTRDMQYIDYGLGFFDLGFFRSFPSDVAFDLADVYSQLVKDKELAGYEVTNRFYEIGSRIGLAEFTAYIGGETL